jgi:hypothetical protein
MVVVVVLGLVVVVAPASANPSTGPSRQSRRTGMCLMPAM